MQSRGGDNAARVTATPEMPASIRLEDGEYGRRAVITHAWSAEFTELLIANNVTELELNDGKGWRGHDLSFLKDLSDLRSLKIIDLKIQTVSPIHFLHELRQLTVMTYCKTEIRFSEFPHLESCTLEWRPKAGSLFDCKTLKELFINRYSGKEFVPFARLIKLEWLALFGASIRDLRGIGALTRLRYLRLGLLRQLTSLAGIEGCAELETLQLDTCRKLRSIDPVRHLSRLRNLHFGNCGEIESLAPLDRLQNLEWVTFPESTNILDGDLVPLLRQKHLRRVAFQNRRHYSHRRETFQQYWKESA